MTRSDFLSLGGFPFLLALTAMTQPDIEPETFLFADDGKIPNSKYPLLLYRKVFQATGSVGALGMEERFAVNNWTNFWRDGVFPYHHYHSITHEVLGVYSGSALLQLGGEKGQKVRVQAGDVIVIPAGVGHKKLESSADFGVMGAYPDGRNYDLLRGEPGERPQADKNIAAVPLPATDPLLGKEGGVTEFWK
ncbi:cupin domain-containing protein [Spirosoma sp. KNUC1025]|uniref:cupin domain-containing protein n=1 Tax=Spirosoma sp. KNUC1025 TaxID=2894082 RepID=UPI00386A11E5|nr:cupin domain-containing protein [Spirosoma sp. KNUC1025]